MIGVDFELLAQPPDIRVQHALVAEELRPEKTVHDLLAFDHAAGRLGQHAQEIELARGQLNRIVGSTDLTGTEVDGEGADLKAAGGAWCA
jgi:hypothetical protein